MPSGNPQIAEGQGGARRGSPDFQQILAQLPALPLNEIHKGEAVIVLATEGSGDSATVIKLVTGIDPILQAAPSASGAAILSPWSLGAPAGDSGGP